VKSILTYYSKLHNCYLLLEIKARQLLTRLLRNILVRYYFNCTSPSESWRNVLKYFPRDYIKLAQIVNLACSALYWKVTKWNRDTRKTTQFT